ncbi:ADP-ribose pyrophosphatase YjhB, NUDIX family [Actinacidiphila alni]|uniref:ADP-ribose pyrophosphatase YjhB, NUDIX family n=1 Tax=Actinacidiphila alni TaxID=380248 RepID=A0A1I2KXE4_9ACTN|nr:CoA pyrophosphatase [Actinacidiphila alni]SFF71233.1 ADP-ribose pyrophosphatase YjhB, NUDIX family [Actinacidiphila alni]
MTHARGAGTGPAGAEPGAVSSGNGTNGTNRTGGGVGTGGVGTGAVEISAAGLPSWLTPVADAVARVRPEQLSRFLPPDGGGRQSAVLILFGDGDRGPELLLIERSRALRSHAGQSSFPGGALDPEDGDPDGDGPVRAALREAEEETGLDPSGVQVFGVLPRLYIPVSGFVVTPVVGWWRRPTPVGVVDPAETARVFRVPLADFIDPANRATLAHPSGFLGPAFLVEGALVWGFTAGLIDKIVQFAGWEQPWDHDRKVPLA